jgi:hypothetical protein
MKKQIKALSFSRETLRTLTEKEKRQAGGMVTKYTLCTCLVTVVSCPPQCG